MFEDNEDMQDVLPNDNADLPENEGSTAKDLETESGGNGNEAALGEQQSQQENKYYAAARRRAETEAKQALELEKQSFIKENLSWMTNPATEKPFESLDELQAFRAHLEQQAAAANVGITSEQYSEIVKQVKESVMHNDPEVRSLIETTNQLKAEKNEAVYAEVLKQVKQAYPDEKASHIRELGTQFLSICANGVDPLVAYEAVRNSSKKKEQTPSMGDVGQGGGEPKDFYTKDEVEKMTDKEFDKNYEAIFSSMSKWK